MRFLLTLALSPFALGFIAAAQALETPLILVPPGGASRTAVVVTPGHGTLGLYSVDDNMLTKQTESNFIADVEYFEKTPYQIVKTVSYSYLRMGASPVEWAMPPSAMLLNDLLFPSELSASQKKLKTDPPPKSLRTQAIAAEDAFWAKDHPYDGTVLGAYDGEYILLALPAKHAVIIYQQRGDGQPLNITAFKNYGPELLLPQGLNTSPAPADIFRSLPEEKRKELEKAADGMGLQLPAETPKSELWVTCPLKNVFVLVDSANQRVMTYFITGKKIQTNVRNLKFDLMVEGYYNSKPSGAEIAKEMKQKYGKALAELGYPDIDLDLMKSLVAQHQVGAGAKPGALQASLVGNRLVLDFTAERKLLVLLLNDQNNLQLSSIRDYTVDTAAAILVEEIKKREKAASALKSIETLSKELSPTSAIAQLTYVLSLNPYLGKDLDKASGRLKSAFGKAEGWDKMIADAAKAADELDAKMKEAIDKAKEAKEKRKEK